MLGGPVRKNIAAVLSTPKATKKAMKVFFEPLKSAMAPNTGLETAAIKLPMATAQPPNGYSGFAKHNILSEINGKNGSHDGGSKS